MTKLIIALIMSLTLILSGNQSVYAAEYPNNLYGIKNTDYQLVQENHYTYEYDVYYYTPFGIYDSIQEKDYFLVSDLNILFRKGLNRGTNSYEFRDKHTYIEGGTAVLLRITVLKSIVNDDYQGNISTLFSDDTMLYVSYLSQNPDYDAGYLDGYDEGYEDGIENSYSVGYNDGHSDGYNKGLSEGFDEGFLEGDSAGYTRGYNKGLSEGNSAWGVLFGAMMATFGGFLAIEIFPGLTIGMLVAVPLILGLLAFIIGIAKGGKND